MKKTFLFITILLALSLQAKYYEATYKISYGALLELGEAKAKLKISKDTYNIRIEARTVGMAKYLTNNRTEIYESKGRIINNDFSPEKFIKIKKDNNKQKIKTYTFFNKQKKIKVNTKNFGKKKFIKNLKYQYKKFSNEKNEVLDFFAEDDLLSLFFDMHKKIINFKKEKEYSFKAVGANKKTGKIDILLPKQKLSNKMIVYINQKIFGSKRGELFITLNKEGFCKNAILKDVLLFGDIVGEMINFEEG